MSESMHGLLKFVKSVVEMVLYVYANLGIGHLGRDDTKCDLFEHISFGPEFILPKKKISFG